MWLDFDPDPCPRIYSDGQPYENDEGDATILGRGSDVYGFRIYGDSMRRKIDSVYDSYNAEHPQPYQPQNLQARPRLASAFVA